MDELHAAIRDMNNDKTAGLDGYDIEMDGEVYSWGGVVLPADDNTSRDVDDILSPAGGHARGITGCHSHSTV